MGLGHLMERPVLRPGNGKGDVCLVLEKGAFGNQKQVASSPKAPGARRLKCPRLEKSHEKSKYNGKQTP